MKCLTRCTVFALGSLLASCGQPEKSAPTSTGDVPASPKAEQVVSALQARFGSLLPSGLAEGFDKDPKGFRANFGATSVAPPSAKVVLPARATGSLRVEDTVTGLAVDVRLDGARDAEGEAGDGYLVYARAHASGATVLHRPMPDGVEDYLSFETRPSAAAVTYKVALAKGVAGLRLVEGTLELLDARGAPRLRVAPPYLVGADGVTTDAALAVEGCAVDRDPAPPWDRPVTAPGASTCTLRVSWKAEAVSYPALLDPRWTTTGSMTTARQDHTLILLPTTSRVLVAGGRSSTTSTTGLATAQLFDRTTGTWATTGSMTGGRFSHSAVLLNTSSNSMTSGKVLVAGGMNGSSSLNTAQLFSPSVGTWIAAGNLNAARHGHTATRLANGRVLVTGGLNGTTVLNTAATFNPASGAGSWTGVSNMSSARRFHSATLLSVPGNSTLNNKVLVVGGNSGGTTSLSSVQLFDGTSAFTTLTALSSTREGHTATELANGNVLIVGGRSGSTVLSTTRLFNAASGSGSWSDAGTMTVARNNHTSTRFPSTVVANGQVLAVGGSNGGLPFASAELWNGTNAWSLTSVPPAGVQRHAAVLLSNNAVLIAGGTNFSGSTTSAAAIYDPSFALACTSNSQCASGFCAQGVCCSSACTAQCSACNLPGTVGTCSPKPNGSGCNDANLCTQLDSCQNGACTGSNAKVCPEVDACRPSATCNPSTGACPVASAGTSCSDGDVCNGTETCDGAGVCKSGTPKVCVSSTGCAGPASCHPTFGCQGGPGVGGQTCNVSDACTTPGACSTLVNVDDPTPDMEDHCWRQRDIPIRFVDFTDLPSPDSNLTVIPNYMTSFVEKLNETFAKACLKFHLRTEYVVRGSKFTTFAIQLPTDKPGDPTGPNFNWATPSDRDQWPLAIPQDPNAGHPQRPTCDFNVPTSGNEISFDAAFRVLQTCGIPDELVVMSQSRCCGFSLFPWRGAYIHWSGAWVHEVGHNLGLQHPFDGIGFWGKPTGIAFGQVSQTAADEWDLVFRPNSSGLNRYFASFEQAQAAADAGEPIQELLRVLATPNNPPTYSAIHLPGTYTNPPPDPPNPVVYSFPPKTGTSSCASPPDGLGSCATRPLDTNGNLSDYCYACEFRRMYEAWNGQGSFPPSGRPLGLVFAAGQSVFDWRVAGQFTAGFSGFEVETVEGSPGPVISGLAPKRTKLQVRHNANKLTHNTMSYGVGRWPPADVGAPTPLFDALSDSQVVLNRNILKADLRSILRGPIDTFNPKNFGHYPARGSWEKIGEDLDTSSAPTIVAATGGAFIAATSSTGEIVYRRWSYGDAPWASQSWTSTVINGPAWQPVIPGQAPTLTGWVSGAYRASDDVFDVAIHRADSVDEVATASLTGGGSGRLGWGSVPAGIRGAPLAFALEGSEGARTNLLVLGNSGDPSNDLLFVNQWRRNLGPGWTGWYNFNLLPNIVVNGFDAAIRPNHDMDIVVMTEDGSYHNAFLNPELGWWDWGDLGNPNPGSPFGSRPSVSSTINATTDPGNPFLQIVITATDNLGRVWMKLWTEQFGGQWSPSPTGWFSMGGSFLGRAAVSHTVNGDIDIVAFDTGSKAVKFKRWRAALGAWSPSQDTWFNLGGEGVTDPIAIPRHGLPDVVDVFTVDQNGALWHRPFVVPPYVADPKDQQYDVDYNTYCGTINGDPCGFVSNATSSLPAARFGTADCPCSR
jgi:hypothetical protein